MNGNVTPFPNGQARKWIAIEKNLRKTLPESGLSNRAIDRILSGIKPFYEIIDDSFSFHINIATLSGHEVANRRSVQSAFRSSYDDFTERLLAERLSREIELVTMLGI